MIVTPLAAVGLTPSSRHLTLAPDTCIYANVAPAGTPENPTAEVRPEIDKQPSGICCDIPVRIGFATEHGCHTLNVGLKHINCDCASACGDNAAAANNTGNVTIDARLRLFIRCDPAAS